MKRVILLIGILVVLAVLPAPSLPARQNEPNAEPNRPSPEKTDIRVIVSKLENQIESLQKQVRLLQADNAKNKSAVEGHNAKFTRIDNKLGDLENRIRECCASKQSSPEKHQERVTPKK